MNKEEIDWLKEHIWEIYKYEKSFGQDSMPTYSMSIELLSKICRAFDYLQQENKQLKEQVDRLIKKEYEKDNDYIVKVRTGEQLEREQYLLCFKSKSMLASMLIDAEEKIDKAIEYIKHYSIINEDYSYFEKAVPIELLSILKGEDNE